MVAHLPTLLYVAPDAAARKRLESELAADYHVLSAASAQGAADLLRREQVNVVLAEQLLPDMSGVVFLSGLVHMHPRALRLLAAPDADAATLLPAINEAQLHGFLRSPLQAADLRQQLHKSLQAAGSQRNGNTPAAIPSDAEANTDTDRLRAELTKAKIDVASVLSELKATKYQLMIAEKMAALGQLLANVSHEINTPVSAVRSSAASMERMFPAFVHAVPRLARRLDGPNAELLERLLMHVSENEASLSTREERQARAELEQRFTAAGLPDAHGLAKSLVEMQLVSGIDAYEPLFALPEAPEILDSVRHLAQLRAALSNLSIASEKVTKIILALKGYSYVSKDEKFEPVRLDQNIQGILTIYHNLLKHGVQVVRNFVDTPTVPGIPDQLGQVWANLIHNAIQAMRGSGTLTLDMEIQEPYVHIGVTDTGEGIPQDVVNRIFEPFFTTKPNGEGSGLGLDICRRIVERHRGRIDVSSVPGRTTFSVLLPLEQNFPTI